jgi:hypothetical protein
MLAVCVTSWQQLVPTGSFSSPQQTGVGNSTEAAVSLSIPAENCSDFFTPMPAVKPKPFKTCSNRSPDGSSVWRRHHRAARLAGQSSVDFNLMVATPRPAS